MCNSTTYTGMGGGSQFRGCNALQEISNWFAVSAAVSDAKNHSDSQSELGGNQ